MGGRRTRKEAKGLCGMEASHALSRLNTSFFYPTVSRDGVQISLNSSNCSIQQSASLSLAAN